MPVRIKKDSRAKFIGFYDLKRKLLCIREIIGVPSGIYFNIADNDQKNGPCSAADNYSIFNSDEDGRFFELETVGGADIEKGFLKGSMLVSKTNFAIFEDGTQIEKFIQQIEGKDCG